MSQKKINNFITAINREAEEMRESIESEVQKYVDSEMERAESELLDEAYNVMLYRISNIRRDIGRELSKEQLRCRRELFRHRDDITERVFAAAADRINAFTADARYPELLISLAKAAADEVGSGFTVLVSSNDMKYADTISSALGCNVAEDGGIAFGGAKAVSADGVLCADNTLDARLDECRKEFRKTCGLVIE